MSRRRTAIVVALVALVFPALIALRVLSQVGWDPSIFVAFGEDATPTREYAEARLGEVFLRADQGHDGKFFFVQANDPWLKDPAENAHVLDRPLYRSQRMLYPVLAGGAGLFPPGAIVWAMLIVNLLAMGAGTWVVSQIAVQMGGSPWWGLAFAFNLGFFSEMLIGGAGVVAATAAFAAVLAILRDRKGWGTAFLVIATLAREAMLIAAAGSALWFWLRGQRKDAIGALSLPIAAVVAWAGYLRLRIGEAATTSQIEEIGYPFVGFAQAFGSWLSDPVNLAAGVGVMALLVLFARRAVVGRRLVGLAFVGFVLLGILFTEQVWRSFFDITRAVAPIITSFVLLLFLNHVQDGVAGVDASESRHPATQSQGR